MSILSIRSRRAMSTLVLALAAGAVLAAQPETKPQPEATRPAKAPQPGEPGRPARAPGQPVPPGTQPGGEQLSLETSMKMLNRGMRELKDKIGSAEAKTDNLRWISTMQRASLNAKAAGPREFPDRADEFRKEQIGLMRLLLEMEESVTDGKADKAEALYGKVRAYQEAAHAKFDVKVNVEGEGEQEPGKEKPGEQGKDKETGKDKEKGGA